MLFSAEVLKEQVHYRKRVKKHVENVSPSKSSGCEVSACISLYVGKRDIGEMKPKPFFMIIFLPIRQAHDQKCQIITLDNITDRKFRVIIINSVIFHNTGNGV